MHVSWYSSEFIYSSKIKGAVNASYFTTIHQSSDARCVERSDTIFEANARINRNLKYKNL